MGLGIMHIASGWYLSIVYHLSCLRGCPHIMCFNATQTPLLLPNPRGVAESLETASLPGGGSVFYFVTLRHWLVIETSHPGKKL